MIRDALLHPFRVFGQLVKAHKDSITEAKRTGICYSCGEEPCEEDGQCNRCYNLDRCAP